MMYCVVVFAKGEKSSYIAGTGTAIGRYTLAVQRRYRREGEPEADFLHCVAFGKAAEFSTKYFQKGQMVSIVGRLQTGSYMGRDGVKRYKTDVIVEEQHFAESKKKAEEQVETPPAEQETASPKAAVPEGFYEVEDDEDLPF